MATFDLTILGCGDAFCSGGRYNSAFYLKTPQMNILMDCGPTTLLALKKYEISVNDIDIVLISHFHGDHFGGLVFLLLEEKKNKREKPLYIISPVGMDEKMKSAIALYYPGSDILESLDIRYKFFGSHQEIQVKSLMINTFPMKHAEDALPHGFRLSLEGTILAYSGDTEWSDELLPLADGADLFICECNFYETKIPGHLSYRELRNKPLNFRKILLTHLGEEMLDNLDKIDWDVAEDGMKIKVISGSS